MQYRIALILAEELPGMCCGQEALFRIHDIFDVDPDPRIHAYY